jgi:hypothetical protein
VLLLGGGLAAGVGLVMLAALTRAGFDLVTANGVKVLVNLVVTMFALPEFILQGNVVWAPALVLAVGFMGGGWFGAKLAVKGGERLVRIFMIGGGSMDPMPPSVRVRWGTHVSGACGGSTSSRRSCTDSTPRPGYGSDSPRR